MKRTQTLAGKFDQKLFDALYSRSLVYNTCWEDPAVDRQALELCSDDRVLVITSAGCNVLAAPRRSFAVGSLPVSEALRFHPERARELARLDRVHTYAGFHIADIAA